MRTRLDSNAVIPVGPALSSAALPLGVAGEIHRDGFTILYVEARAGTPLLTDVVEQVDR